MAKRLDKSKMPVGMEVGLGSGDFLFDGDPATSRIRAHPPHPILAYVYCGQMAGWMNTPLGTEVGLMPVDFVFDGDQAPSLKRDRAPNFRPMSIAAKRLDAPRSHLVWR